MKKIIIWLLLLLVLLLPVAFTLFSLYQTNYYPSSSGAPNIKLTTINYVVQIGYNVCYIIVAIAVLIIARDQLNKTREATTIQTLTNFAKDLNSDEFKKKRKELATFILLQKENDTAQNNLILWFKNLKQKEQLNEEEILQIAFVKNIFEAVIYYFENLAYYYKKDIYSIEDIYQLFSYEIQRYWLLMEHLGFIAYLRFNEADREKDFYNKFGDLFMDTLIQELINESHSHFKKSFFEIYYYSGVYKLFYWVLKKFNKKGMILILKEHKLKRLDQFLIEEENLV